MTDVVTVCNEVAKVMFLHLSVSHSVHRRESASVHAGIPPPRTRQGVPGPGRWCLVLGGLPQCMLGCHTPGTRHSPRDQAPPPTRTRHPPVAADTPGADTPWSRHPPPGSRYPPSQQTATAADGTHPTGMHSC